MVRAVGMTGSIRTMRNRWILALFACASAPVSAAAAQPGAATGKVRGVAYDSVNARPLGRALIQMVRRDDPSRSRRTIADSLGRFAADSLTPGEWLIAAIHPRLDSLAVEQLAMPLFIRASGTTRARIAVPSSRSLIGRVCGENVARDSSGYVHGRLRNVQAMESGIEGTVRIDWLEFTLSKGRVTRAQQGIEVNSTPDGSFVACGVPAGGIVRVRAWSGADSTGVLELTLPAHGIARLDLATGSVRRATMAVRGAIPDPGTDSLPVTRVEVRRGDGALRGTALGIGGKPLESARVTVWGTGVEAVSAADGAFALNGLPTGTQTLETRAIGYQPVRQTVDILPDESVTVSAQLERLLLLDTVRVRAMRTQMLGPQMAGFMTRQRQGIGRFLGPDEIEKQQPFQTSDLFRRMAGAQVVPSPGGYVVQLRGGCTPTLYIDGMRFGTDGNLDNFIVPSEVRAIELYASSTTTPPQFLDPFNACGSIVIWTGPRR